ncbi:MAG: hypothetical protein M1835_006265 [Candelina submexicana]|nr:MAG: hypothetical protein M1835_006265 [Candelina submexicana]
MHHDPNRWVDPTYVTDTPFSAVFANVDVDDGSTPYLPYVMWKSPEKIQLAFYPSKNPLWRSQDLEIPQTDYKK